MNQILATERIYVTPELRRKKKFYKFHFFLSVFLVCILFSFYIYAEYDRNKNEELSQELLADIKLSTQESTKKTTQESTKKTTIDQKDNIILVALEELREIDITVREEPIVIPEPEPEPEPQNIRYSSVGEEYYTVAIIKIPKINIEYTVLNKTSDTLLKISPTRFWGPDLDTGVFDANEIGNFCIVGHNYRNSKFFSKVPNLVEGDTIELTDMKGRTVTYALYNQYTVDQSDVSCTDQETNGKREVTLITCTYDGTARVVTKFREI